MMIGTDGALYNHEVPSILVDGAYAQSGPLRLSPGNTAVRRVFLDNDADDSVELEFLTRQFSTDSLYSHGTFSFGEPVSTTGVMGKEIHMKVTGLTNRWRFGSAEFDVQQLRSAR